MKLGVFVVAEAGFKTATFGLWKVGQKDFPIQ
jgi:hypothetical protein